MLGSGGREHAIISTLRRTSKRSLNLYCIPGNAGIALDAVCKPLSLENHSDLINFAKTEAIDLTFVGPEAPLAAGIVDEFEKHGLKIVGPGLAAARLEGSKVFGKDFMARHNIPTARYRVATSLEEALELVRNNELDFETEGRVIKADGLAAGKGVVVATTRKEAEIAVQELMGGKVAPTDAASRLVIEEPLQGREVSVLLFAAGQSYKLMPAARDHKRIGENDTGPNTGGMGAITDSSVLDGETLRQIEREVIVPTLQGAEQEGFPFSGILFVGLMLTGTGPKVLEYNVRFGDPETQAILVRLESDLLQVFEAMAAGSLGNLNVNWSNQSSACVVLASGGYPGKSETGEIIEGLESAARNPNVHLFHAGTARDEAGNFLTAGGRVLGVTAVGDSLSLALRTCYDVIDDIGWRGMQFRRDIGAFRAFSSA